MIGECKWYRQEKGYGFIKPQDGSKDVFVHDSQLRLAGIQSIQTGDRLSFDIEQNRNGKGDSAKNIVLLNGDHHAS